MLTIIDGFEANIGAHEYNGIVAEIQRWFYGDMVADAWCATSLSYFADKVGVLYQLGGKNEGVREMLNATKNAKVGTVYEYPNIPHYIPRGCVLFFLRNNMSHVSLAYEATSYSKNGYIRALGGNQSDEIRIKSYPINNLQAIFIPNYGDIRRPTIYKGYKDSEKGGIHCAQLQEALNRVRNAKLEIDGSCGKRTLSAILEYQEYAMDKGFYTGPVDGRFGPRSWRAIFKEV